MVLYAPGLTVFVLAWFCIRVIEIHEGEQEIHLPSTFLTQALTERCAEPTPTVFDCLILRGMADPFSVPMPSSCAKNSYHSNEDLSTS